MEKILIAENDRSLNNGIALALKAESYLFVQAFTLKEAMKTVREHRVGMVILSSAFPDGESMEFLRELKENSRLPVIVLMEETDSGERYAAMADDCIPKPFGLSEVRKRVNHQVRTYKHRSLQVYQLGELYFSFQNMEFYKGDRHLDLSTAEQNLLRLLVENRGLTMSRSELMSRIWNIDSRKTETNALSVAVKRLRDKLEDNPGAPRYIKTVYGIGYSWTDRPVIRPGLNTGRECSDVF